MATTRINTYVQAPVNISRLVSIGPGDEDVNSKGGRTTRTRVMNFSPTVDNNRTQIYLTVVYEVEESHKDYTHLRGESTVVIQAESGSRIVQIGPNGKNATFYREFRGEDHGWHDITDDPGVQGSYFGQLRIKFDDKGDDNHGNAQLYGFVNIPVILEIEVQAPPLEMSEWVPFVFKTKQVKRRPF